jgi:hypothetical protein
LSRQNGFGKPSAGLGVVGDILGVTTEDNAKTSIGQNREQWKAVWEGDHKTKALDYIVAHCIRDVKLNSAVFDVLWSKDYGVSLRRI